MHWVSKKDARELGLLPSVTSVLKLLRKPALEEWLIRTAVAAVVTAPDVPGEGIDAKITRVLDAERQQDEEAANAASLGSDIHAALELCFKNKAQDTPVELWPWISQAMTAIEKYGKVHAVETILIGNGYGGLCDLILEAPDCWWLFDHKTTRKLPTKGAYVEARLQLAAYAAAFHGRLTPLGAAKPIHTANCYISTTEQGKFVICEHDPDWQKVYNSAFAPLLQYWHWANGI